MRYCDRVSFLERGSVRGGEGADDAAEVAAEVCVGSQPGRFGDLGHGEVGAFEEFSGQVDPGAEDPLHRGDAGVGREPA